MLQAYSRFAENLAAGTGDGYDIATAIKSWTDEVCELTNIIRLERRVLITFVISLQPTTMQATHNLRISLKSSGKAPLKLDVHCRCATAFSILVSG